MGLKLNNRQLSALADEILEKLKLDEKSELDVLKAKFKKDKDFIEYQKLDKEYDKLEAAKDIVAEKLSKYKEKLREKFKFRTEWSDIDGDNLVLSKTTSKGKIEQAIILESIGVDDVKSITEAVIKKFNK